MESPMLKQRPRKTKAILEAERNLKILISEGRSLRTSGAARHRPAHLAAVEDRASELAKRLRIMRRGAGVQ